LERFTTPMIEAFGPERLMWGSDWPVVNLASDVQRWLALSLALLAAAGPAAVDAVFRGNATRFYRLTAGWSADSSGD
jgi:L-fuconolactonase